MKLHGPYSTDPYGVKIYGRSDKDDGLTIVLDIRGWGYLTGDGHGALGLSEPEAIEEQKRFARFVVDALNNEAAIRAKDEPNSGGRG